MVVIRADERERGAAAVVLRRLDHALDVGLDRHPGPVRRHHDADRAFDAVGAHRRDRLRDERLRVLHPEVGAERARSAGSAFSRSTRPVGLRAGRVQQREHVADRGVSLLQLREVLGRRRPAAADVRVVALDVVGAARGPVRHHQHADRRVAQRGASCRSVRSWTRSTSRRSVSGSVVRQHAVPEVEDVPVASARAREHAIGLGLHHVPRRRQHGRIEVALHGHVGTHALPRDVERRAPVHADHVAARSTHRARAARPSPRRSGSSGRRGPPGRRTAARMCGSTDRS